LPGTNCGQCGFAGCPAGAKALAEGSAPVTLCPPGGKALAQALADKLGLELDLSDMGDTAPRVALVIEEQCIGCTRCFKVCPTDAIVGAPKQLHSVIGEACTGCNKCTAICPTMGIVMCRPKATLQNWQWPKPAPVAAPLSPAASTSVPSISVASTSAPSISMKQREAVG